MCDDLQLKHPISSSVRGPSVSGKSSFCIRFLQNLKILCTVHTFDGGVIWCYRDKSAVPSRQLAGTKNVRFNEVVPANFDNPGDKPFLIIQDDLLKEAKSNVVFYLFPKAAIAGISVSF